MAILYTVDSMTVGFDEFRSRITEIGYYKLPQQERTWVHIPGEQQIIMVKSLNGKDGEVHTFRVAINK
jgi:hypothetical protein